MRYFVWSQLYGLALWLATHGPRRGNGDRWLLPVARFAFGQSSRIWRDTPDW